MSYLVLEILWLILPFSLMSAIVGWVAHSAFIRYSLYEEEPATDLERKLQEQMELTMRLRDDLDTSRTRLRDLDAQLVAQQPERRALESELGRRNAALRALEKGVENGRVQLGATVEALERSRADLKAARIELEDARVHVALLEEQSRQLRAALGDEVVDEVMASVPPAPSRARVPVVPEPAEISGTRLEASPMHEEDLLLEGDEELEALIDDLPFVEAPTPARIQAPMPEEAELVAVFEVDDLGPRQETEVSQITSITAVPMDDVEPPGPARLAVGGAHDGMPMDGEESGDHPQIADHAQLADHGEAEEPEPVIEPPAPAEPAPAEPEEGDEGEVGAPTLPPAPSRGNLTVEQARERVVTIAGLLGRPTNDDDDLEHIKGIGPKTSKQLNELGITTFRQLALLPEDEVDVFAKALKYSASRIRRSDWVAQARKLHRLKTGEELT